MSKNRFFGNLQTKIKQGEAMAKSQKTKVRPKIEGLWRQKYKDGFRYLLKGKTDEGRNIFVTVPLLESDSDRVWVQKCDEARHALEAKCHPPKDLNHYLDLYFTQRNLREGSRYQYSHYLRGFSLDDDTNARRVQELLKSGKSESSIKQIVGIINTFYKFLVNSGVPVKNPVVGLRTGRFNHRTRLPTDEEIQILMSWAESQTTEDQLYLRLLIATGARCSSLNVLRYGDLSEDGHVSLVNVKCGKRYDYPVLLTDATAIELWRAKHKKDSDPLFDGAVATSRRVKWACYKKIPVDNNGERISPHSFRHLFATRLVRQGVDLATVSKLLDHSSVATTLSFYAQHSQDQLDTAIQKI